MSGPEVLDGLSAEKAALRKRMMAARRVVHRAAGAAAAERVAALFVGAFADALAARPTVAGYWPMVDELDVRPLLERVAALGCPVGLPVVTPRGTPLVFRAWRPGAAMVAGVFGTSHPADATEVTPELVIAPLLAFDAAGRRLGYGGGYYDRTLARLRAAGGVLAVGVGYDAQEVERVPTGPSDRTLDAVVTETRVLRIARCG